ncbi:MAG: TOBE domain-containing protein, partial [Lachnospiraceae bacterium]|nr:TOBE domain-containing protein [Lachnospiraceae bacterium]
DVKLVERGTGLVSGVVTDLIFKGVHYEMCVDVGGREWVAHSTTPRQVGKEVDINVHPYNIQVMKKPESKDEEAAR